MLRRWLIVGSLPLLALSLAAQQDNSSPPAQNPPTQTNPPAPQKKDQPKKSTAQENPFPEAQSEAAAKQAQQQGSGSEPSAPEPSAPQPRSDSENKPATSDQNPFPEAQSQKAAHQAGQGSAPHPGSPDDQNDSSSRVKGLDMPTTGEVPPPNLPPSSLPYDPKLARKDAQVGDYYMESGNWQGAYERFLEANRSDPGNAEAVYGLAESARHLHRPDEALRNYRLYLAALPNGPRAKDARKALKEMGAEPAS